MTMLHTQSHASLRCKSVSRAMFIARHFYVQNEQHTQSVRCIFCAISTIKRAGPAANICMCRGGYVQCEWSEVCGCKIGTSIIKAFCYVGLWPDLRQGRYPATISPKGLRSKRPPFIGSSEPVPQRSVSQLDK
jgi:hypothetical protein